MDNLNIKTEFKGSIFIGSDFEKTVTKGTAYVDKSLFIDDIIKETNEVILITMPRRWGKSYNLDMLRRFLSIEEHDPAQRELNEKLFTGGTISIKHGYKYIEKYIETSALINKFPDAKEMQGTYPVIFIDFKNCTGSTYNDIITSLKNLIENLFMKFYYLSESIYLNDIEKEKFQKYLNFEINKNFLGDLEDSIRFLSELLFKHHKQKVWILIDEYDSISNNIFSAFGSEEYEPERKDFKDKGHFKALNKIIASMMSSALKGNAYLEKGVLTGILKLAKSGMLSGLNNVKKYNFLKSKYCKYYGFSDDEIEGLRIKLNLVKSQLKGINLMANGYQYGSNLENKLYNTWSTVNYLNEVIDGETEIEDAWEASGDLDLVKPIITSNEMQQLLQQLCRGKSIEIELKKCITFESLVYNSDSISNTALNILLWTGYLTPDGYSDSDSKKIMVKIPNMPVMDVFKEQIFEWGTSRFDLNTLTFDFNKILENIATDQIEFEKSLNVFKINFLNELTKAGDNKTIASFSESTMHNILYVICLKSRLSEGLISNKGFGEGKVDIALKSNKLGIVIELKYNRTSIEALGQIKNKVYYKGFNNESDINKVLAIGINLNSSKDDSEVKDLSINWDCYLRNYDNGFMKLEKPDFFNDKSFNLKSLFNMEGKANFNQNNLSSKANTLFSEDKSEKPKKIFEISKDLTQIRTKENLKNRSIPQNSAIKPIKAFHNFNSSNKSVSVSNLPLDHDNVIVIDKSCERLFLAKKRLSDK